MVVRDFLPDYSTLYTSQEAEHELKGFKFQGPGWYFTETGATLVAPEGEVKWNIEDSHERGPWKNSWRPGQKFWFFVWSVRNPADAFNAIVNAPVRQDER